MSNNKQSSVEFFLYGMASLLGEFENKSLPQERIMALFEQAKAMHKAELEFSFKGGMNLVEGHLWKPIDKFEEFYNAKFGDKV